MGGNTQVGTINEKGFAQGLVLGSSPLIKYVTIPGLTAHAGHGNGWKHPSISGAVSRVKVLLYNGEIVEMSDDPADPHYHPDFKTLMGAHFGLLGIILEADVKCVEAQKLECKVEVMSLKAYHDAVEKGLFLDEEYPYVSAMYIPTYSNDMDHDEIKSVIVYRF